jgi:hypothetical protein
MRKFWTRSALLLTTSTLGLVVGIYVGRHQPPTLESTIKHLRTPPVEPVDAWSIGILAGSTPFDLRAPGGVTNPVLTGRDVTDIDACFVADPFVVRRDGHFYMFFEVMNRATGQGDIAYADSADGRQWRYGQVVIDEAFHLSYPHVFEWEDEYYLIPESQRDFSLRLYKAREFPRVWVYVGNLLSGYAFADPTILRYHDRWWLFVGTGRNNVLNLYFSEHLQTGWQMHLMSPVVKLDPHRARPGGRVIVDGDRLYRLAQDDAPDYGARVWAYEITDLTETTYAEKLAQPTPLVEGSGRGWNAAGMHHMDVLNVNDGWLATVDGRSR